MSEDTDRRRQARADARKLADVAKAIAGTIDATRARALSHEADQLASSIRLALAKAHDPKGDVIKRTVAAGYEPLLQAYGAQLREDFGAAGFALLVFAEGLTNYVSNCVRDDIVVAMQEFIAMHELDKQTAELGGMTVQEHRPDQDEPA